jgi:predicted DNA-binding transcriptional regulator YafY
MILSMNTEKQVRIIYTNWRGETAERTIEPIEIWYGSTEWHPEEQWLLKAIDVAKKAERDFAVKAIQKWLG